MSKRFPFQAEPSRGRYTSVDVEENEDQYTDDGSSEDEDCDRRYGYGLEYDNSMETGTDGTRNEGTAQKLDELEFENLDLGGGLGDFGQDVLDAGKDASDAVNKGKEAERESKSSFEVVEAVSNSEGEVGGKGVMVDERDSSDDEEPETAAEARPRRKSGLSLHVPDDNFVGTRHLSIDGASDHGPPEPRPQVDESRLQAGYDAHDTSAPSSRPITPVSLFRDFDGVHCSEETAPGASREDLPLSRPPAQRNNRQSFAMPDIRPPSGPPAPGMVYYPAPVPAVLNLPPKMAKPRRDSQANMLDNRRSQMPLHSNSDGLGPGNNRQSVMLDSAPLHVEKESAVNVLDSILDFSVDLPPVAFTDHPLTGAPAVSYTHRNSQMLNARHSLMPTAPGNRVSMLSLGPNRALDHSQEAETNSRSASPAPSPAALPQEEDVVPTTLLAELESRKAKQKMRSRTAATISPHGIRNTLLELDAVAQMAATQRRTKRTHLAWEAPEEGEEQDPDEDVPLAILQAVKKEGQPTRRKDLDLPDKRNTKLGGLLLQKELEDTEPLSARRNRLLQQRRSVLPSMPSSTSIPQIPPSSAPGALGPADGESEEEEETLAQRRERLKNQSQPTENSGALPAISLDTSLDLDLSLKPSPTAQTSPSEDEEEETLAQRRARLQKSAQDKPLPGIPRKPVSKANPRMSMQMQNPVIRMVASNPALNRQSSYGFSQAMGGSATNLIPQQMPLAGNMAPHHAQMQAQMNAQMQAQQLQQHQINLHRQSSYMHMMGGAASFGPAAAGVGGGAASMVYPPPPPGPRNQAELHALALQQGFVPLNQAQKDRVERWRAGVV